MPNSSLFTVHIKIKSCKLIPYFFPGYIMATYFNIDVDSLILDHKLSYQNAYENVTGQVKELCNNNINLYAQKIDENHKISSTYLYFDIFLLLLLYYVSTFL